MTKKILYNGFCVFLVFLFGGCQVKKDEDPVPQRAVLVSYTKLTDLRVSQSYLDQVLSAFPEFSDDVIQNLTQYGVNVYKIIYKTTYKGNEKRASGACLIPDAGDLTVPVVSYQHGTIFKDDQAPSRFSSMFDMSVETGLTLVLASCGYIVSASDYIGFCESGDVLHPYHHAESTAAASVDMLRAVLELCRELKIKFSEKYFLMGYSEGGFATLASLKKIQADYSALFPITACSAGAGAYDLRYTAEWYMDKTILPVPAYPCFILVAFQDMYNWASSWSAIFQGPYSTRIANGLFNGDYSESQINDNLTSQTDLLCDSTFLTKMRGNGEQALKNALSQNSLCTGWFPTSPTRLYHGTSDTIVPLQNSTNAQSAFLAAGATSVHLVPFTGLNHSTAIVPYIKETIQWFKSL